MDVTNTPRARALAHELRKAREAAGLTLRQLASLVGKSHTTLSFWETAQRIPSTEDSATLLAHCGINGAERERIMDIARHAGDINWLTAGMPGVTQQLAGVLECESTATKITEWIPLLIPGLLQTGDYARYIVGEGDSGDATNARVRVRVGRRDVLTRRNAATFVALIGEAAVRDEIGDQGIMSDQLQDLLAMAQRPNVEIRIVRGRQGWHPGLAGPFVLYEFTEAEPIVHLEHFRSGVFLYDEGDVTAYRAAVTTVEQNAMSPEASTELIAEMISELEKKK